jgi:hypothetical protein
MWLELRGPLSWLLCCWLVITIVCAIVAYNTLSFPPSAQQLERIAKAPTLLLKALNLELLTFEGKIPNASSSVSIIHPDREIFCAEYPRTMSSLMQELYALPESVFWSYSDYMGVPEDRASLPPDNSFAWTIRDGFGVLYRGSLSKYTGLLCLERYPDMELQLPDPLFLQWRSRMSLFAAPLYLLSLIVFLVGVGWKTRFVLIRGVCAVLVSVMFVFLSFIAILVAVQSHG